MMPRCAEVGAADEAAARRRHPTGHPWRTDGVRLAQAIEARWCDEHDDDSVAVPVTVRGH